MEVVEKITKEQLMENLNNGEVVVTFTKKDGSERVMRCTRASDSIPEEKRPILKTDSVDKSISSNIDLITVWDLDREGWRSFDYRKILNIGK